MRKKALLGIFLSLAISMTPITVQAQSAHDSTVNEFTYDEAQLLMKVAEAEAGNQGEDGMWLVMSVIVNRVNDDTFPDNVTDVVMQKHQFETVTTGAIDKVEISAECHRALARIETGEVAEAIVAFENSKNKSLERYFSTAFEYRDHVFYTLSNN